ncbi:Ribosomal RNA small subunit methyltransferase G [Hyella patelloides LEGE 07179]|uniref:Ribosomal RNA small subunit methyltransferase G n=1 Tax=Hyella patelloides LEGE 07179 TaxID=945734 RepID=A0A563VK34_9CYAN|nr:16S rRNA (guanine(527)-N(7))-methyltransferase RsmG [Hyella patelloides]VEP11697.1 Ribosomal RNA small subunit methyltransferase G [Hyella patelloides LEGE 07179]
MERNLPTMLDIWDKTLHWQPSDRQNQQFAQLYTAILEGNKKQNLTRITKPQEFWEKHLWDSLLGVAPFFIPDYAVAALQKKSSLAKNLKIIDIGTGAGFPGLPLAIANPDWSVTMVDSTRKKIAFILRAIAQLQLSNAEAIVSRAEALARQTPHREQYDLALIRAVGQASVCAEYILPFVKIGGFAVLYRGYWEETDTIALKTAVNQLGSEITLIKPTKTPLSDSIRHCIYLYKKSSTPDLFPRQVGVPNQQPL